MIKLRIRKTNAGDFSIQFVSDKEEKWFFDFLESIHGAETQQLVDSLKANLSTKYATGIIKETALLFKNQVPLLLIILLLNDMPTELLIDYVKQEQKAAKNNHKVNNAELTLSKGMAEK